MRNLTMLMDYYELTMSNGYFEKGFKDKMVVFDMFYRKNPDNGGFVVSAGLEQLIEYIENMHFSKEDIEFLRSKGEFSEGFLQYLADFKFTGNIDALPEGTICYPNTPIVTVTAPVIEAQLIETMLLLTMNFQSLIATKASRICRTAAESGAVVMERFSVQEQPISVARLRQQRSWQMNGLAYLQSVRWHIAGFSFLTMNTKRLRHMQRSIRTTVHC